MAKEFSCPYCGGHQLKTKVEFIANVKGFDEDGSLFVLGNEIEREEVTFLCWDCDWETISPSFVQDCETD